MSAFTKTKIVDIDGGGNFTTIREATDFFINQNIGGTIIVEAGEYEINGTIDNGVDKRTVLIPSNVTLIGRGNVVVKVTRPGTQQSQIYAFINSDSNGNENIIISGFKIVVACGNNGPYNNHLIFMQNVSNSRFEKLTIDLPINENIHGVDPSRYAILIYSYDYNCTGNIIKNYAA
jgi:hypothetical protein